MVLCLTKCVWGKHKCWGHHHGNNNRHYNHPHHFHHVADCGLVPEMMEDRSELPLVQSGCPWSYDVSSDLTVIIVIILIILIILNILIMILWWPLRHYFDYQHCHPQFPHASIMIPILSSLWPNWVSASSSFRGLLNTSFSIERCTFIIVNDWDDG